MNIYKLVEKYASQPAPWFDFEPIQSDYMFSEDDLIENIELKGWGGRTPTTWEKGNTPWNKGKDCPYLSESKKLYWKEWKEKNPDHKEKWKKYEKVGFNSEARSERAKDRNKLKATCPHCGKVGQMVNMKRWHFENCRHKG